MAKSVLMRYNDTTKENIALAVYETGYQRCSPGHHPLPG